MRKITCLLIIAAALVRLSEAGLAAQQIPSLKYLEASELTIVGKLMPTSNPYWRVDADAYPGFTKAETRQVHCGAGMSIAFKTDSRSIYLSIKRRPSYVGTNTGFFSSGGFDLYIKEKGKWRWAGNTCFPPGDDGPRRLIELMDGSEHECLMYLPIHTELFSVQIGVDTDSSIEPLHNPFRHRIVFTGSSYTHGSSSSRAGMSYVEQLGRMTLWDCVSLGCGGNGRLQPHYADVLCDVQADAFVFDQFSNPSPEMIAERLRPFVEKLRAAHPGTPLIFQRTIRRENRNFNTASQKREAAKKAVSDSLMERIIAEIPDVYLITPVIDDPTHEFTVDGTHPDNYGYYLWARSIVKPLKRILKKYGIK